jgi:hypothetical protein
MPVRDCPGYQSVTFSPKKGTRGLPQRRSEAASDK